MDTPCSSLPLKHPFPGIAARSGQAGFSLVEVLIALVILSFGLLGAVGMQVTALQASKEARNQATATTFARELAERMRGNHSVAIKTTAADNPYLLNVTLAPDATIATPAVNCFTGSCAVAKDAATWDAAEWQGRVRDALPSPRVKVCYDETPFDASGKPRWDCTNTGDVAVLKMSWTRKNTAGTLEFSSSAVPTVVVPLTAGSAE